MKIEIPKNHYRYNQYKNLLEELLSEGKVTGDNQSEALLEYTKLNLHRMHRWEKTFVPTQKLVSTIESMIQPRHWIIITEGWCGDAAQQLPIIEKLASLNSKITTHYVLRDENPDLMNQFLTNGSKSIPIWICADDSGEVLWSWGPRPKEAIDLLESLKSKSVDESMRKQELHSWYAKNRQVAFQSEIEQLHAEDSVGKPLNV
jgi:hypothetical protein